MTDINLDALSLSELKQLEKSVAKAITSFEDRRKAEARARVDELARELGYSFEELARLHRQALIARGPRSPEPGAPYTYVTTPGFLIQFGLETLRDLPDIEALQDAGLLKPVADVDLDMPIAAEQE
ncbi:SMC-Scp complex subunit ScpB [Pseudogemmobacter faecipullorum]|uniref:SMC-Scp complex subunit ScpB n=1 Tax=Pseudogemmobacter faecipullorum TaxID=2755041 RepID=UPI001D035E31|nr:SMC-Scp complex subunit ScpB [Pseudogemmobacter faecipullorum]